MSLFDHAFVALTRRAAAMLILEPTEGPWQNQNTFGDQRTQPLPATAGQIIQVLPKNTRLYGPPAVHSVQLVRGDEVFPDNANVYARVTYGCGGINNQFFCDWVHGAQFALVCNSINVDAVSYAPGPIPYQASGGHTFLGASVAKGSVQQGRCPLSYTEAQVIVAGPGAHSFDVQRDFAREVTVHLPGNNDPSVATGIILEFINSGGFLVRYDAQVCAGGRSIPIPGGSSTLVITNTTLFPAIPVVQWFLGL